MDDDESAVDRSASEVTRRHLPPIETTPHTHIIRLRLERAQKLMMVVAVAVLIPDPQ